LNVPIKCIARGLFSFYDRSQNSLLYLAVEEDTAFSGWQLGPCCWLNDLTRQRVLSSSFFPHYLRGSFLVRGP